MDDLAEETSGFCSRVQLTPTQCNEVIVDKLASLMPLAACTLDVFSRVNHALKNGGINWKRAFERAKAHAEKLG